MCDKWKEACVRDKLKEACVASETMRVDKWKEACVRVEFTGALLTSSKVRPSDPAHKSTGVYHMVSYVRQS